MDSYSSADLVEFIRAHCPDVDETAHETIIKGKVSGKRALRYTTLEWTELGIPYGDAVDIAGAINEFVQGNQENCYLSKSLLRQSTECGKDPASKPFEDFQNTEEDMETIFPVKTLLKQSMVDMQKPQNDGNTCAASTSKQGLVGQAGSSMTLSKVVLAANSVHQQNDVTSKYECLRPFFAPNSLKELSNYEKDSYLNIKENYELGISKGLKLKKPNFMVKKPVYGNKSESLSLPPPNSRRSKRIEKQPQVQRQQDRPCTSSSEMLIRPTPSSSNAVGETGTIPDAVEETEEQSAESDFSNTIIQNFSQRLIPARTLECEPGTSTAINAPQDVPTSSASSNALVDAPSTSAATNAPSTSSSTTVAKKRKHRKKASDLLPEDEFFEKLPKYDVKTILIEAGRPLKAVRKSLAKDALVTGAERKLMMRTLTKHLYYDEHGKVKNVTTDMKSGMAASITHAYPLFKDNAANKRSWWRLFDPSGPSGYLANWSTGIVRKMNPDERQRGGGQDHIEVSSDEDTNTQPEPQSGTSSEANYHDPDAVWMSLTMPFATQKGGLLKGMEKSFKVRRDWINQMGPSITEILKKYPHLMSFGSEMMEKEFDTMYPEKGTSFLKEFPNLVHFAKSGNFQNQNEEFQPGETNDIIGTCFTLANQLPRPNLQRYNRMAKSRKTESVMPELNTLVQTIPIGVNPKDVVRTNREGALHPVQPYLMALVPDKQVVKIFLVADSELIELNSASILRGLDLLFKSYSVFNVEYPLGWKVFWEMVEHGLFKIEPQKLTNSAHELLYQASKITM